MTGGRLRPRPRALGQKRDGRHAEQDSPPEGTIFSASARALKVLPVPGAMTSLPRSDALKPRSTSLMASRWWDLLGGAAR
jgi:hypothetical protein